jgi:hypothetical protein
MVVVVADPRFVSGDGTGRLNLADQSRAGQGRQHVVYGLPGHLGKIAAHRAENRFGVGVRMGVYRFQHRQSWARHAKVSRTELIRVIRCLRHGPHLAPFLE